MHLSDLLEEFLLNARAANRSPRTIQWYQFYVPRFERFLSERGYSTECASITPRMLREYVAVLQETDAPSTVNNSIRTLKAVFAFGVRDELIDNDPTTRVPVPKVPQTDYAIFDSTDVDVLLKACDPDSVWGLRDFAIVMLLFDSGIRASELVQLRDDDIDWTRGLITVFGKGSKERSVPVSARTLRAVRKYLHRREKAGYRDVPNLFISIGNRPMTYNGLRLLLRRLGKKTGLHVYAHKFRHSFAVNALRNDAREFDIQQCLGHTTLMMTRHYARQSGEDLARRHKHFSPADRLKVRV